MINKADFCQLNEGLQIKEIYATFGLCIYEFQVVEQQLMNMILMNSAISKLATSLREFDQIFDNNKEKTMGRLIQKVFEDFSINEDDRTKIWHLHNRRNYFAHHYFKDKISEWFSEKGRLDMLDEISTEIKQAEEIDQKLMSYTEPYMVKMKITNGDLEKIQNDYIKGIRKIESMIYDKGKDV